MLCGLATCTLAAHAQSDVTLYGTIDQYIGYIHSSSGAHVLGVNDGTIHRSRIGVRGSEDLGDGYRTTYDFETGLVVNTGAQADSSRLFDRQAWIGLVTPVGEFRAGRQNAAIFEIGDAIDYTERTTFGSLVNTFGTPSRYDNDLMYQTKRYAGLQLTLHYALPENGSTTGTVVTKGNHPLYQLGLDYSSGRYRFGYAGLSEQPNSITATVHEAIVYHNIYANYHYSSGTLYFTMVRSNNSTSNANGNNATAILSDVGSPSNYVAGTDLNALRYYNIYQISADYRITLRLKIGALYGVMRDMSGGDAGVSGGNMGGYYDVTKRTHLYSYISYMKNQVNGGWRFSGSAAPTANLAGADINGKGLLGLQAGIVLQF